MHIQRHRQIDGHTETDTCTNVSNFIYIIYAVRRAGGGNAAAQRSSVYCDR
eukprot:COSAG06_NODE_5212_length_3634_cov_16.722489_1_plen_51_part_00